MSARRGTAGAVLTVLVLLLGACGGAAPGATGAAPSAPAVGRTSDGARTDPLQGEVVVLAAASLSDTFTTLARRLEADHPGLRVTTSFAGSSALAQQVLAGAPADVLATASSVTMAGVQEAGLTAATPVVLARNELVLAVPAGNPGQVRGLGDLARDDLVVALCQEQVPCGAAAASLLGQVGVAAAPDTLEQDVRGVLTKLRLGEVDAGLVYRTDVAVAGEQVEVVPFAPADARAAAAAANDYLIAPLTASRAPAAAAAFVAEVMSAQGQGVLAQAGFVAP